MSSDFNWEKTPEIRAKYSVTTPTFTSHAKLQYWRIDFFKKCKHLNVPHGITDVPKLCKGRKIYESAKRNEPSEEHFWE